MFKSFYFKTIGLLLAMFVGGGNLVALADELFTYTVNSTSTLPETLGSAVSYSQTTENTGTLNANASATLTVTGVPENVAITGITLNVNTYKNVGIGSATATLGNANIGSVAIEHGNQKPHDVNMEVTKTFGPGNLVITISAFEDVAQIHSYKITYIIDNRPNPNISFTQETCSVKLDGAYTTPIPSLSYDGNGTVTYSSSNENVATVNATGEITPHSMGQTVITATIDGTDEYRDGMASYTLSVGTLIWMEDFSSYSAGDQPSNGDYSYSCNNGYGQTILVAKQEAGGLAPEMQLAQSGSFSANIPLNRYYGGLVLTFYSTNSATVTSTTTGVTVGTITNNDNLYSVEITVPEKTEILNLSIENNSKKAFHVDNIYLFAPDRVENVSIEMNGLGIMTYASYYALDFGEVEGLTAYAATGITGDKLTMTNVEQAAAGEGLMLKGEAGTTYLVPITDETPASVVGNMLVGLIEETEVPQVDGDYTTFILAAPDGGEINWYKLREQSYSLRANSAYLKLLNSNVPTTRSLTMDYSTDTDGINNLTTRPANDGNVYDLQGRKVNTLNKKGIYIIGGRKVVMK